MLISFDMPISLDIFVIPCGIFISPFSCFDISSDLFGALNPSESKLMNHSIILDLCREAMDRTAPKSCPFWRRMFGGNWHIRLQEPPQRTERRATGDAQK